jgi:hypothetical protein
MEAIMKDSNFKPGAKVIVKKSRKLGNNVKAEVISDVRLFGSGYVIAEWSVQVKSENGVTLWSKLSNLELI